ncbi:MAG: hypothetical protein A3K59_08290 [Euryarchaeota archaeon RBG_19FT_COMBO_69_17]|nr:MAG: hypothetical protein A3K59_08290 [Euryarchaeota archaeon RBG_19FT_COMBO_69_17]
MRPSPAYRELDVLRAEYAEKGPAIRRRLAEFRTVGRRPDRELFEELCFCLLAVQTKARASDAAVRDLADAGLLWSGDAEAVARSLRRRIRFHNQKAAFLVAARERFFGGPRPLLREALDAVPVPSAARGWLVAEVDGLGFKEASHFLRNIGRGDGLAILDRHILRNLLRHGVLRRTPSSLTPRRYLEIEVTMRRFSEAVGIGMEELDLVFWSRATGEIFK